MCETRRKYTSQQFDLPPPKGEVTPSKNQNQGEPLSASKRRSPVLSSSANPNSPPLTVCGSSRPDLVSFEMSMKTVEMLALIKGTTPQEAYLLTLAEEIEEEQAEALKAGELNPEDSLLLHRQAHAAQLGEDDDEEEEDYLLGGDYETVSDDGAYSLDGEYGYNEGKNNQGEREQEEEIFEIEM